MYIKDKFTCVTMWDVGSMDEKAASIPPLQEEM